VRPDETRSEDETRFPRAIFDRESHVGGHHEGEAQSHQYLRLDLLPTDVKIKEERIDPVMPDWEDDFSIRDVQPPSDIWNFLWPPVYDPSDMAWVDAALGITNPALVTVSDPIEEAAMAYSDGSLEIPVVAGEAPIGGDPTDLEVQRGSPVGNMMDVMVISSDESSSTSGGSSGLTMGN